MQTGGHAYSFKFFVRSSLFFAKFLNF